MVRTSSVYKATSEQLSILDIFRKPPTRKTKRASTMSTDEQIATPSDLAAMVVALSDDMKTILDWIKTQSAAPSAMRWRRAVGSQELLLQRRHSLTWWKATLQTSANEEFTWSQFKQLICQKFYPMGYEEKRWKRWHVLRQRRDQTVQDYPTDFRRQALGLGISLDDPQELEEGGGRSAKAKAKVLLQALRVRLRVPLPRRSLRRVRFLLAVTNNFLIVDADVTIEGF
uniref:Retrotransposon gag domain-containing protein n=1 Tax=Ananas comosus var. bracteatus TaxID=296719 RepID=A0A6V7PLT7_ANACO|nr:unnamed protein product [Ananas comosus var. bracteatus]